MSKAPSAAQLAARKKFGEQAKERAAIAKQKKAELESAQNQIPDIKPGNADEDLKAQIEEMKRNMDFMRDLILKGQQQAPVQSESQGLNLGHRGQIVGTVEKYSIDAKDYPDPRERLAKETKLKRFAFDDNYDLGWEITITRYETKDGYNQAEPRFELQLNGIVFDDETGEPTNRRYIIRKGWFHEDPQTAIIMANKLGMNVVDNNSSEFLNEMRYLRMRDWLVEQFYPTPALQGKSAMQDVVIGGKAVQMFTVDSDKSESIPFDRMTKKL